MSRFELNKITLLNQATLDSLKDVSVQKIIARFTETGVKILGGDFGFAWWKDRGSNRYRLAYRSKKMPYNPPLPRRGGINYQVQKHKAPFFASKLTKETDRKYDVSRYLKSYVIIPIHYRRNLYGNLVICYKRRHIFTPEERSLSVAIGNATAQVKTIHRLYNDLKNFKDSLDRTLDAIIIFDPVSLRLEYVNQGAVGLLRRKRGELYKLKISELLSQKARPVFMRILDNLSQEEENSTFLETNFAVSGRRPVPVEILIQLIKAPGQPKKFLVIGQDITNRRATERQIQKLLKQKDEFLGVASHELRTPITTIKGFAQLLEKKNSSADQQSGYFIAKINSQIDKLARLVEELLDVSKIEAGKLAFKRKKIKLNLLLKEIVEGLQFSTTQHEIILNGKIRGFVPGDPDRLGQVFTNILTNAIKYSPSGGQIIVRLRQKGATAMVSVQDFGIGIPERHQRQIFNRFFQGRHTRASAFPGLGLGLYISREIVRRHGGDIWFSSEKDKGTTFYVELPRRKTKK